MRALTEVEQQWLFAPEALRRTPSQARGMPLQEELKRRRETIEYIRSLVNRLEMPLHHSSGLMTVASVLVHRFYMRQALQDFEEKLIAPTVFFLASKIEEEPAKLRHIVNACLNKFGEGHQYQWFPQGPDDPTPQSLPYKRWENEILACEEILLETLCFDMDVDQPFEVLLRAIRGLDSLRPSADAKSLAQNGQSGGHPEGETAVGATETRLGEFGWMLFNQMSVAPLCVVYPAAVIAAAGCVVLFAVLDDIPLSLAKAAVAEIAWRFGLEVYWDEAEGATGLDLSVLEDCLRDWKEYCETGLLEKDTLGSVPDEPPEKPVSYTRRFLPDPNAPSPPINGHSDPAEEAAEKGKATHTVMPPVEEEAQKDGATEQVMLDLFGDQVESE